MDRIGFLMSQKGTKAVNKSGVDKNGAEELKADIFSKICKLIVSVDELVGRIDSLRPVGHWEKVSIGKYKPSADYLYKCDQCGTERIGYQDNYCPNCGAKMDKGVNDDQGTSNQ